MFAAEVCTGLRMSMPASTKCGMRWYTEPQLCRNVFHRVCSWIHVAETGVVRLDHLRPELGPDELPALGAGVVRRDAPREAPVAHRLVHRLQAPDGRIHGPPHHLVAGLLLGEQHHQPLVGQPHGDVARRSVIRLRPRKQTPYPHPSERVLGVLVQAAREGFEVPQLEVRHGVHGPEGAGVQRPAGIVERDVVEVVPVAGHAERGARPVRVEEPPRSVRVLGDPGAGREVRVPPR